jgi:diketogulonate reductase-like aldo/keto reductase
MDMIYKRLGNTDIRIPAVAQGTTRMGTHENHDPSAVSNRVDLLKEAVDLGSNLIDTAELYGGGFSEEVVGKAISGMRERVVLASKFNPREPVIASLNTSIENSLRRLKTDYLDLYQIHWPNPSVPMGRLMEGLSKIVDQGKVRHVGLSNFTARGVEAAQSVFDKQLTSNQTEYGLLDRTAEDEIIPHCVDHGLTVLAYGLFDHGTVSERASHRAVLRRLAEKHCKTIHQIVLRWAIHQTPVVALTKTQTSSRLKENIEAAAFDLDQSDIDAIAGLSKENSVLVPLRCIDLGHHSANVYSNIDEALENRLDLIPSPANMARLILEEGIVKPIRLRTFDNAAAYELDGYDLMDQVKKYWAWSIAYGGDSSIPAFVRGRGD